MLGPPWAKKFWSRANQLLRGAPIRCQNRPKQAKRGSKKSPQTLPFSHFQVMVGHLGPKYLGKTPNVRVTSTQSKKSARAYPWYPVELTFLLVLQFEKFQVLFVYIIHMLVFSDHFDLLDIPGYARASVVDRTKPNTESIRYYSVFGSVRYFPEIPNRIISGRRSKK